MNWLIEPKTNDDNSPLGLFCPPLAYIIDKIISCPVVSCMDLCAVKVTLNK